MRDNRQVVKRAVKASAVTEEKLEQEMLWRIWFPNIQWLPDQKLSETDRERLLEGFVQFCRDNIRIKHPSKGNIPLELRDAQIETVRGWLDHRYTVVLKARQIGFSTIVAIFTLWCVMGWRDRDIVMLSSGEREAISLLTKARYAYRKLPEWVKSRGPSLLDRTKERMTFDNDSKLWSLPSASDPARGESVFLVVIDEWGKFPNQEEAWASVEPIADIGGRVIGLGTARGEGSFFHHVWTGSQNQSNDFYGMFFPWSAVPERDDKWYERKTRNMLPWQIAQEYPANAEEAFIGSGNPFFDLDVLRTMVPVDGESFDIEISGAKRWRLRPGGELTVWKHPVEAAAYVIGADTSQGLQHGDFTVAYVMDANTGEVVAEWRGKPDPDVFGERVLPALGWMYNYAVIAPEANNHGITTIKGLQRAGYGRIFRRRTILKNGGKAPTDTVGWLTTHTSKPMMMDELGAWLRDHNVPSRSCLAELKTFVRTQRGDRVRLHGSPHDDCVIALAITVQAKKYAVQNHMAKPKDPSDTAGSIAWWAKKLESERSGRARRQLNPVF